MAMNEVPTVNDALLTDVDILATVPVTAPVKLPVLADITNLPIELPSNIEFDVGAIAVVFATRVVVVKLAAFILLATNTLLLVLLNVNPADPFELVESLNCICVFDPPTTAAAP